MIDRLTQKSSEKVEKQKKKKKCARIGIYDTILRTCLLQPWIVIETLLGRQRNCHGNVLLHSKHTECILLGNDK